MRDGRDDALRGFPRKFSLASINISIVVGTALARRIVSLCALSA